VRETLKMLK
jgi:hypothetical protein